MVLCPATCRLCFSLRIQTLVLRLYEERVIPVRVQLDMHLESYLRDVTGDMRSPWKLRCRVKEFAVGDQRCAETRENSAAWLSCDCQDDTEHRGNPNCARADDLTGNSQGSGCGNVPHQQFVLFRNAKHFAHSISQ